MVTTHLPSRTVSPIFGPLTRMGEFESSVLKRLKTASDARLLLARAHAGELKGAAWRIECACDAELLRREHAKRGRGNKDTEGAGPKAAVALLARALGCNPRTIERNAQIYNELLADERVKASADVHAVLDEKSFFEIALRARSPFRALKRMARLKTKNPAFSARDARRLVERMNGETDAPRAGLADRSVKVHIEHVIRVIETDFSQNAPKPELVKRYYSEWLDDMHYELDNLNERQIRDQVLIAWLADVTNTRLQRRLASQERKRSAS